MPLTWASVPVGKPVIVSFVVRMGRVNYVSCFPAILYVHSNAGSAGFGSPSRLFDLGTFDWIWRRPFRQLVGECLILCRFAFRCGPFC
jgi:hypothetical protein